MQYEPLPHALSLYMVCTHIALSFLFEGTFSSLYKHTLLAFFKSHTLNFVIYTHINLYQSDWWCTLNVIYNLNGALV